jgi:hypothetical protein
VVHATTGDDTKADADMDRTCHQPHNAALERFTAACALFASICCVVEIMVAHIYRVTRNGNDKCSAPIICVAIAANDRNQRCAVLAGVVAQALCTIHGSMHCSRRFISYGRCRAVHYCDFARS